MGTGVVVGEPKRCGTIVRRPACGTKEDECSPRYLQTELQLQRGEGVKVKSY